MTAMRIAAASWRANDNHTPGSSRQGIHRDRYGHPPAWERGAETRACPVRARPATDRPAKRENRGAAIKRSQASTWAARRWRARDLAMTFAASTRGRLGQ